MTYFLGIDCGGTHLRIGLVGEDGQILAYSRIKSPLVSHPDKFGQTVYQEYQQLTDKVVEPISLQAIGVGVPGPIDRINGSILHSANLHNDSPIHFVKQLEQAFSLSPSSQGSQREAFSQQQNPQPPSTTLNHPPVYFDRDAEVSLWGEFWQGAAKDCSNCLMLTLGTGIGGAIMVDNKIVTGVSDNAGEIGHMYLSLSSPFVSRYWSKPTSREPRAASHELPTCGLGHQGCFEAWFKNASIEDKPFVLGIGLASLVDIFNPGKIILGGGVIEFGEIDLPEAIAVMRDKSVKPLGEQTEVVKATLGDKAGVVGAAYLARQSQATETGGYKKINNS